MLKRGFIGVLAVGCLSGCVQRDVVLEETASRLLALPPESSPFVRILRVSVDTPRRPGLSSGFSIGNALYVTAPHHIEDSSGWVFFVEGYAASVVRRSDLTPDWDDWMVLKADGLDRPSVKLDADWKSRPNEPFKVFGFDYSESKSLAKPEDILAATPLVVVDCYVTPNNLSGATKEEVVVARSIRGRILQGYSGAAAMGRNGVFAIAHAVIGHEVPGTFVLLRTIQGKPGTLVWDSAD